MQNPLANLISKLDALSSWHKAKTDRAWLVPVKTRAYLIFSLLVIALAIFASAHMRDWQFDQWKANKGTYYLGETPLFSTTDASYFLNSAKAIKDTGSSHEFSVKRQYPNYGDNPAATDQNLFSEPLLSIILAKLAPDNSNTSLLRTANNLLPWTAALTALAIVLAFGAAGFWAEGAIAAVGGSLSLSYLVRSSVGRIDTDQLNLGFFYLVTALIIWAARSQRIAIAIGLVVLAGLTNNLFSWWWPKDILSWGFLGGLLWLSFACHRDWRRTVLLAILFVITSGTFWSGGTVDTSIFTDATDNTGSLILPNTFSTITELARIPFGEVLSNITGDMWLGFIALVGLAGWAFVNPMVAIVFAPAILLGVLNIVFGNRVIFFSAPIIWFGLGWLVLTTGRFLADRFFSAPETGVRVQTIASTAAISLGLIIAYLSSGNPITKPYVPRVSFSAETVDGFRALGSYVKENRSTRQPVIATWWDYGYAATLFSDLPTLHDGGSQRGLPTHLVARALLAGSQYETARILKFIANDGRDGVVKNGTSNETLNQAFIDGPVNDTAEVYLVLTMQMARWMPSISTLGLWNMQTGTPVNTFTGNNKVNFQTVSCTGSGSSPVCNGQTYDLAKGTIDGQPIITGAVQTNEGFAGPRATYDHSGNQSGNQAAGFYLQLHNMNDRPFETQVIQPVLFNSTFNQLFFLGAHDDEFFTPVLDAFPFYRVYRVN